MSSLIHPVGPEPPGVYWLRRAALLLVIITLAMGAWWAVNAVRGSDEPMQATGSATAPAQDGTPAATDQPSAGASDQAATPSSEPTVIEDTAKECTDSAILVEAKTDAKSYPVESSPRLTMTITNTGDVACTRDVGTKANEMEITSGGYHVWSSDDCATNSKSKVVTLQPGDTVASSITWDGRLSQKGCPSQGKLAKAGRYDLVARNSEVRSEKQGFALLNP